MLVNDGVRRPQDMATALRLLARQPKPSTAMKPGMLDGLNTVNRLSDWLLTGQRGKARAFPGTESERQRA
jgi:hypothetical protein